MDTVQGSEQGLLNTSIPLPGTEHFGGIVCDIIEALHGVLGRQGDCPFFLGRGEISLLISGRREIGLILGRFYLQQEGRLGFLILGRGEIRQFNFRERGDWTPPCRASLLH